MPDAGNVDPIASRPLPACILGRCAGEFPLYRQKVGPHGPAASRALLLPDNAADEDLSFESSDWHTNAVVCNRRG
jgi:hypothetical protein